MKYVPEWQMPEETEWIGWFCKSKSCSLPLLSGSFHRSWVLSQILIVSKNVSAIASWLAGRAADDQKVVLLTTKYPLGPPLPPQWLTLRDELVSPVKLWSLSRLESVRHERFRIKLRTKPARHPRLLEDYDHRIVAHLLTGRNRDETRRWSDW